MTNLRQPSDVSGCLYQGLSHRFLILGSVLALIPYFINKFYCSLSNIGYKYLKRVGISDAVAKVKVTVVILVALSPHFSMKKSQVREGHLLEF